MEKKKKRKKELVRSLGKEILNFTDLQTNDSVHRELQQYFFYSSFSSYIICIIIYNMKTDE